MTNGMTNLGALAILVGALFPILGSFTHQNNWPRWVNMGIIIIVCGAVGTLTVWAGNSLHWASFSAGTILITIAVIFTAGQALYAAYFKESPVAQFIDAKTQLSRNTE